MRYSLANGTVEIVPNSQRKKLSHKGKTMLNEKMKEIEAFNSLLACTAFKRKDVKTRKEKRARCFICKERGHALWKCHNKKNKNKGETLKALAEKRSKYPERVLDVEEDERKFIFSYGIGEARIETKVGALIIPNVHYTPEITMNVLSMEQLENQGYIVTYEHNRCVIKYMFDEEKGVEDVQEDSMMDCEDSARMIESHNKFLDEYFELIDPKIDPKEECSLIRAMEDLKMEKEDFHDYIDDEYLSMNGTLYAMKDVLGKLPPVIGVTKVDLLGLYKFMDNLGGYMNVSFNNKWNEIAKLLGVTQENQYVIKECYKEYIGMAKIYYEEAKRTKQEKPRDVVGKGSGTARIKGP
nr:ARID DNA-binding domain-containing protein [Tanacetum cinerariifolium]